MPMPSDIGAIDLMIGFPAEDARRHYDYMKANLKDEASAEMEFPAEYMFKDVPEPQGARGRRRRRSPSARWTSAAWPGASSVCGSDVSQRAVAEHPDRFVASIEIDPNDIAKAGAPDPQGPRGARHQGRDHLPVGLQPAGAGQRPTLLPDLRDLHRPRHPHRRQRRASPGPGCRRHVQDVMHFDQVCYDFPELVIVMRHGAEPWEELAVKLMLKWPGLYYMTSAFAPKYYPKAIIDYANTRGADKIMYAGYYPMGLSLERIFTEMPDVPFRDHVWPQFLRENALRVFKLDG